MDTNGIEAYVKFNYFHKEQKRKIKNDAFHAENLFYNAEKDYFVCPMGQHMEKLGVGTRKSELGYISNVTYYQAKRCQGCPLRSLCHKSQGDRCIEVNHQLRKYKEQARKRLLSEQGIKYRKQRAIEPEAVFGQLKSNNKFNRFRLRTLEKVSIDFGLAAISHNLRKMSKMIHTNEKLKAYAQRNQQIFLQYRYYRYYLLVIERYLSVVEYLLENFCKIKPIQKMQFFTKSFAA